MSAMSRVEVMDMENCMNTVTESLSYTRRCSKCHVEYEAKVDVAGRIKDYYCNTCRNAASARYKHADVFRAKNREYMKRYRAELKPKYIKCPFPYPGGKQRLLKDILPEIPSGNCYCEPFCGGLSVGLQLVNRYGHSIISDLDPTIVNLWHVIKERPDELIDACYEIQPSREMFHEAKDLLTANDISDSIKSAALKLCIHRISYCSIGELARGLKPDWTMRWKPEVIAVRISDTSTILQNTEIYYQSYNEIIERAPRGTAFYIDPPYVKAGRSLYKFAFTEADHRELVEILLGLDNWVLSYDDHPLIRELYAGCNIHEITAHYYTGKSKLSHELLITPSQF